MRISIAILALVAVIPAFSAKEINVLVNTVQQADTGIINQIKNVVMLKRSKIIRLEQEEEPEAENMTDEQMDQIIEGQIEAEDSSSSRSSSSIEVDLHSIFIVPPLPPFPPAASASSVSIASQVHAVPLTVGSSRIIGKKQKKVSPSSSVSAPPHASLSVSAAPFSIAKAVSSVGASAVPSGENRLDTPGNSQKGKGNLQKEKQQEKQQEEKELERQEEKPQPTPSATFAFPTFSFPVFSFPTFTFIIPARQPPRIFNFTLPAFLPPSASPSPTAAPVPIVQPPVLPINNQASSSSASVVVGTPVSVGFSVTSTTTSSNYDFLAGFSNFFGFRPSSGRGAASPTTLPSSSSPAITATAVASKSIKMVNAPHYQIIPQQVSRAPASFSQHAALAEASFPFFPTLDQDQQEEDNFGLLPPEEIINEEQNI